MGNTSLELVDLSDAKFIVELRTADPKRNRHISETSPDVVAQTAWLANYKQMEVRGEQFYFIIKHLSIPVGTIRMLDFTEDSYGIGSWVVKTGTHPSASIASVLIVYRAGFDTLGLASARFDVRKGNESSLRFHKRMGAVPIKEDDLYVYFSMVGPEYARNESKFLRFT